LGRSNPESMRSVAGPWGRTAGPCSRPGRG
jgi:hypothetical protein